MSAIRSVMASWTEPPNTPEWRSLQPHSTYIYRTSTLSLHDNNSNCAIWSQLAGRYETYVVKSTVKKVSWPQGRSSRCPSDHKWCRVWFCPASSCQRCRHSPRLSGKCLFGQTQAHPGPQSPIPPSLQSRIWYWWEAPVLNGKENKHNQTN